MNEHFIFCSTVWDKIAWEKCYLKIDRRTGKRLKVATLPSDVKKIASNELPYLIAKAENRNVCYPPITLEAWIAKKTKISNH